MKALSAPQQYVVDDTPFLWLAREVVARGPNGRLIDLARHDERLAAYLDAMRVHRTDIKSAVENEARPGEPAADFLTASFALMVGDSTFFNALSEAEASGKRAKGIVAALGWAERDVAMKAIKQLSDAPEPLGRAIAIAALGARRSDPGASLATAVADAAPLVRARAYRTAGQLGRTDLMPHIAPGFRDEDPECNFWSAWAAARMGAAEPLDTLAEIAWQGGPRAERALDMLLRRLEVQRANAWLRDLAGLPERRRSLIRATGVIGDPIYIPWLTQRMDEPVAARLAGEAFSMITGVDLAYRDLDRRPPADFQSGPNDNPEDENVALDEDDRLPWPDLAKVGDWWARNKARFSVGTAYFLGQPKASADWLEALSDAFQRQRRAAALELAIRQPNKAMFEVRARGRLQRQLIARARGQL
jgi:uncharacterized protein (TIGR02270 family)